jgi:LacI family transcriptional regulator
LILSEIDGAFFPPLLRGIEAEVRAGNRELLIHSTQGAHPDHKKPLGEHNTDGLLVFPSSFAAKELKRLHALNFPLVLMHQSAPDGLNIPVITIENKDGARILIDHLIEKHNRRRIVFMPGPVEFEDSRWRELGYREALECHGIPLDPKLVVFGGFDERIAYRSVRKLLLGGISFDAVFAGNDDAAIGVYQALKTAGKIIPDDVAVVGFDDVPFARYISPALTTVRAQIEEVGREAVRQLVSLIEGRPAQPLVLLSTNLVIRQSCGCAVISNASDETNFYRRR